jgi:hypothetical protein
MECAAQECEPLELALVEGAAESRRLREHMEFPTVISLVCLAACLPSRLLTDFRIARYPGRNPLAWSNW